MGAERRNRPDGVSTKTLLERLHAGSRGAFDELFERLRRSLRRWSRRRLPPAARALKDTSDIVQDAIARTLLNLHSFRPRHRDALRHYLRTAVRNQVRDEIRRVSRRPVEASLGEREPEVRDSPLEKLLSVEEEQLLEEGLSGLRDKDRELLVARFRLDLTFEQIALALELPSASAARMAVNRALVRLAEVMKRA